MQCAHQCDVLGHAIANSNVPRMPLALRAAGTPIASPATAHRCAPNPARLLPNVPSGLPE
jgi:hypothetical protein